MRGLMHPAAHVQVHYIVTGSRYCNSPACARGGIAGTAVTYYIWQVHWVGVEPMALRDETSNHKPVPLCKWNAWQYMVHFGAIYCIFGTNVPVTARWEACGKVPHSVWKLYGMDFERDDRKYYGETYEIHGLILTAGFQAMVNRSHCKWKTTKWNTVFYYQNWWKKAYHQVKATQYGVTRQWPFLLYV